MLQNGTAWMLVADGRRARLLIERRRGATLEEPQDWNMEIGGDDLYEPQDRPPRALGLLRNMLPESAKRRIRAQASKDLLDEAAPRLRERLTELLR